MPEDDDRAQAPHGETGRAGEQHALDDQLIPSPTREENASRPVPWPGVVASLFMNLVPIPFLYFAYALPPDGPWDRDAIDVDRLAAWIATWASALIAVPQLLLVFVRQLRPWWLLVPLVLLVLAIGRYSYVLAMFGSSH